MILKTKYAEDSTSGSPIIKVTIWTNHSVETHYVNDNTMDTRNTTEIEMFAFCCCENDTWKGTSEKFGI